LEIFPARILIPRLQLAFGRRADSNRARFYLTLSGQCAGAFLASIVLRLLFPANASLGATIPTGPLLQSFVLELILTALLMFVILGVSTGAREKGITAGIVVGSVIGLEAMFAGPDLRRIDESSALTRAGRC
jgi:glycerol uptake facilitator-like aquaporin